MSTAPAAKAARPMILSSGWGSGSGSGGGIQQAVRQFMGCNTAGQTFVTKLIGIVA
jgi:hypothetical protein